MEVLETLGVRHPPASFVLPQVRTCAFWGTSGSMSCPTSGMSSPCLLANPEDAEQKKMLSTCTKMLSLQKTQQADRYSFYSPTKFLHMCLICIPPCPLSHSQGQGDSSWHRGRGAPLTRATAQINWGTPPPWKKQEENDGSLLHHGSPPHGG